MTPLTLTDLFPLFLVDERTSLRMIRCDVAAERAPKIDLAALLHGQTDKRILALFTHNHKTVSSFPGITHNTPSLSLHRSHDQSVKHPHT